MKLIEQGKIYFNDCGYCWIGFKDLKSKYRFLAKQKYTNVPTSVPITGWEQAKTLQRRYPQQLERSAYFRLCDRIGQMLCRQ